MSQTKGSASHICAYIPKGLLKLQLGLLLIVNKAQFDPVYAWCGTQRTYTAVSLNHSTSCITKYAFFVSRIQCSHTFKALTLKRNKQTL